MAMKGQPPKLAEALSGLADCENVAYIVTENSMAPAGGEAVLSAKAVSTKAKSKDLVTNILKFVFGAAAIVIGSQLLVDNGSALALLLGVPERIIAVSVVAIGTSLPELVTTLTAIASW